MCIAICIAMCAKVTQGRKAATQWCLRCSEERQMLGRLLPLKRDRCLGVSVFSKHRHACLKRDSNRLSMWETLCNVQVTMHVHDACGITRRMWYNTTHVVPGSYVLCAVCNVQCAMSHGMCATCVRHVPHSCHGYAHAAAWHCLSHTHMCVWVCTCSSLALVASSTPSIHVMTHTP